MKAREVKRTIDRIYKDYAPDQPIPRAKDARVMKMFEILQDWK